ncbi:PREDICTED: uncharacterized protein LOC109171513 [Ipomoea nil]|uniref:uncharacterized protein LOC109171513 n=1 Tax=Ipomoea nil TaxID=35883 RepID=UPI0009014C30|nr:PREDICTED: uncharacterized protein LOC109171513 [Ipomoea nil]
MGNDTGLVTTLLHRLATTFKIQDLGTPSFFLGIEALTIGDSFQLSQRRYMQDILSRSGMTNCKALATSALVTQPATPSTDPFENPMQYRRIVGALQYLTISRPDLAYSVNRLCFAGYISGMSLKIRKDALLQQKKIEEEEPWYLEW